MIRCETMRAADCARLLGVDVQTWRTLVRVGSAPRPLPTGGRTRPLWRRAEVLAWARERTIPAAPAR